MTGFTNRGHEQFPNWLFYLFGLLLVTYIVLMVYFADVLLEAPGQEFSFLYIVQYMFISFFVLAGYSIFLVKKLKNTMNGTEFLSLSLSQSLVNYTKSYCLLSQDGKIFFYNSQFADNYMSSNDVEHKLYPDLLNTSRFTKEALSKIADSLANDNTNLISLGSAGAKIFPLDRPKGVFALVVTGEK